MIHNHMLYSLRDISIVPSVSTEIKSRSECNPMRDSLTGGEEWYPLITAPMTCVLGDHNYQIYQENKVNPVIPRTVPLETRMNLFRTVFCAFSLKESRELLKLEDDGGNYYVLIDMANGHMMAQIDLGRKLKKKFPGLKLMGGNIANPGTYTLYDQAGFDFVRLSIGTGGSCLSSTQTGVHYGMASLISDIYDLKTRHSLNCKLIADGGISSYSEAIKCLALGADYVMMGKIFAQAALGPGEIGMNWNYRGMSTKAEQQLMGNTKLKTSEGKEENLIKSYTLSGWLENFGDYLRSSMSYCDSRTLLEFSKKAECQVISPWTASKINDK